jgi:putative sterol carrier protein
VPAWPAPGAGLTGSVKDFFDSLAERANGSRAADLNASYVFVVDGAGTWTVAFADGKASVSEGDHGGDCTLTTSEKTFRRILDGDQNPLTAYMTGKLKVSGDVGVAMKLKDVFG